MSGPYLEIILRDKARVIRIKAIEGLGFVAVTTLGASRVVVGGPYLEQ